MAENAFSLTSEESKFQGLLAKLDNPEFIEKFAENPQAALEEAGLEMDLAEFTSELSKNPAFYNLMIKKISEKVDVSKLTVSCNSCCS